MLDCALIQSVLQKARYWDMNFPLFGSNLHAHLFRPPLPERELDAWEELMELRLPADYRTYLTQLGNGGAGPAYGLMPFEFPLQETLREVTVFSDSHAARFEALVRQWYETFHQDWDERYELYCAQTPEGARLSYEDWDEAQGRYMEEHLERPLFENGQLLIANQGCSVDIYLLLNGFHRGDCHEGNQEYDYSYPLWYQSKGPYAPITWSQYQSFFTPFSDYLMDYVERVEELCASLSPEQRQQAQRERAQVREFQAALDGADWDEVLRMLMKLDPTALSLKSRSFYLYYQDTLQRSLPDRPEVAAFFQGIQKSRRTNSGWEFTVFQETCFSGSRYPHPNFAQFLRTFEEPEE